MKCFALFALASVALARPADEAAVAPLVYGLPYGALGATGYALPYAAPHVAYAHAPVVYAHPIDSGLVYPVAEPYVHDATGDVSDNSSPEAEAYVHDPTGDARKKREADAQILLPGAYPYALPYAYHPLSTGLVYPV